MPKVTFCTPILKEPHPEWVKAVEACVPAVEAAGWTHSIAQELNISFVSLARANVLRKALDGKPDVLVFTDSDISWRPEDMVKLLETEGDVVAGLYRYKHEPTEYMGEIIIDDNRYPVVREDGCIEAKRIPAGFMKVTRLAVNKFMDTYPELVYGEPTYPYLDMFNHGAIERVWHGEDYAFSYRWRKSGGKIWVIPDMNIDHHKGDICYSGNFHKYLMNLTKGVENESKKD